MKFMRNFLVGLAAASLLAFASADAQTYPITSPVYMPTGVLAAHTFTTTGDYAFLTGGNGSATVRVSALTGTLVAAVQGTNDNVNWSTLSVTNVTTHGVCAASITANAFVGFNIGGLTRFRVHITTLSGGGATVTVAAAASSSNNPNYTPAC